LGSYYGVTRRVSVEVTRENSAYVETARIKQTEFDIQPIKIAGGVVKVKDELEISFRVYAASPDAPARTLAGGCAALGELLAISKKTLLRPLLSQAVGDPPRLIFISANRRSLSFRRPMGVTFADRAANYR
jgi:hypothetical protein